MTTLESQTIGREQLDTTTGGKHKDFASRYVDTLKQDYKDWWNREKGGAKELRQHHYLKAAGNYGSALLDEVGALGDAIAPVKALK